MKLEQQREAVIRACADLCSCGLMRELGAGGNVSVRDQETDLIALTPSQVRYDTMASADVVVTDMHGAVIEAAPGRVPTSEVATHTMIYRELPWVNAVIHTHALYCTAVASVEDHLPAANYELLYFAAREVPVVPFIMPGTEEMARVVVDALQEAPAMVIRNHGLFVVGKDLDSTLVRAVAVEDAARLYYFARTLGKPHLLPPEVCKPGAQGKEVE